MHYFEYRRRKLYCEDVPIEEIAKEVGTPVYVYSGKTLMRHYEVFDSSFADIPHIVCYSVKANSNISIIRLFASLGSGVDIVSGGGALQEPEGRRSAAKNRVLRRWEEGLGNQPFSREGHSDVQRRVVGRT